MTRGGILDYDSVLSGAGRAVCRRINFRLGSVSQQWSRIMRQLKCFITLSAVLGLLAVSSPSAHSCVGARPYGMGLAFIAVADDINAAYWNPAGLVQLDLREATYMRNVNARDSINYQDYYAYAQPLDENSVIALSYISTVRISDMWDQDWYWLSYAYRLSPETSLGVNIRSVDDDVYVPGVSIDSRLQMDFAVFHRLSEDMTIGLLIQNANEPETKMRESIGMYAEEELTLTNVRNWRPGIAYKPDPTLTVALSVYDALDEGDGAIRHLRLGVEKVVENDTGRYLAYRLGYVGLWKKSDAVAPAGPTLGFGYGTETFKLDAALLMGDFDDAMFVSATARFR